MGIIPTHLLHSPQKMLSLVSLRQEALSDNIANMHTEGYRRKDVDFSQYLNNGVSSNLETKLIDKYGASPISSTTSGSGEVLSTEDELALILSLFLMISLLFSNSFIFVSS